MSTQPDSSAQDRRDQLSKALGAAFLSHQVESLERSVDSLTFSRDGRLLQNPSTSRRGHGGRRGGASSSSASSNHASTNVADTKRSKRPIKVVDASVLVHALPVVKRWLREDTHQLVVPLQAFSTLDVLKRAPAPLHELAREATRFLEAQLAIAQRIESALGGPCLEADAKIRLRAQATGEEAKWEQVERLFQIPPEAFPLVTEDPVAAQDGEHAEEEDEVPRLPSANDLPRSLRSPLQCALYFASQSSKNVLLLFNTLHVPAPAPAPVLAPRTLAGQGTKPAPMPIDFLAVSSGDTLARFVQTHFDKSLNVYVVPSSEVIAAKEWLKALAQQAAAGSADTGKSKPGGGRRGGRGGGGRAGGAGGGRGGRRDGAGAEGRLFVP